MVGAVCYALWLLIAVIIGWCGVYNKTQSQELHWGPLHWITPWKDVGQGHRDCTLIMSHQNRCALFQGTAPSVFAENYCSTHLTTATSQRHSFHLYGDSITCAIITDAANGVFENVCEGSGLTVDYMLFLRRFSRTPMAQRINSSRSSMRAWPQNTSMSLSEIQNHLKQKEDAYPGSDPSEAVC
ncbi:hypothetical protein Q8A73_022277 [Channa argus]|nr:hypothetical protein Q8A73_022277 [Channa argus]